VKLGILSTGNGDKALVQRSAFKGAVIGTIIVVAWELAPLIENDHVRRAAVTGLTYLATSIGVAIGKASKK